MSSEITTKKEAVEYLFTSTEDLNELKSNLFQNKTNFKVKVITSPSFYSGNPEDVNSLTKDTNGSLVVFKGRIIDSNMAHDNYLQDPCDPALASEPTIASKLAALHTTITLNRDQGTAGLKVGDVVTAELNAGDNNYLYDLQFANMTNVFEIRKTPRDQAAILDNCVNLYAQFDEAIINDLIEDVGRVELGEDELVVTELEEQIAVRKEDGYELGVNWPATLSDKKQKELGYEKMDADSLHKYLCEEFNNDSNLATAMLLVAAGESNLTNRIVGDGPATSMLSHKAYFKTGTVNPGAIIIEGVPWCSFGPWQFNVCAGEGTELLKYFGESSADDTTRYNIAADVTKQVEYFKEQGLPTRDSLLRKYGVEQILVETEYDPEQTLALLTWYLVEIGRGAGDMEEAAQYRFETYGPEYLPDVEQRKC